MKRLIGTLMLGLTISLGLGSYVQAAPAQVSPSFITHVAETPKQAVCEGVGFTGTGACGDTGNQVNNVIKLIVNVLASIIGVTAVIMIMIGGFKYITSNGDANSVASAKRTVIYAIVGLVVAALSQVIVRYVLVRT